MWQKTQNNNGLNQREVYPSSLSRPRREGPQLVWQCTVSRTQAPLCKAPIPRSPHGSGGLLELQAPSGKRGKHIEIHAPLFEDTCWKSHKPLLDSGQALSHMGPPRWEMCTLYEEILGNKQDSATIHLTGQLGEFSVWIHGKH